jgi:hypothetical protein
MCNPSVSGGRDKEDHNLKPALGKQYTRPYFKKIHHRKRAGKVAHVVRVPACKSECCQKKKKKKKKEKYHSPGLGVAQVTEHLPCKYKALASIPSTAENKNSL